LDLLESHAGYVRLWSDYMFGYQGFVEFARFIEKRVKEPRFREHLAVIGLLIHRSPPEKIDYPFECSQSALGRFKYMVGFYFFIPGSRSESIRYLRGMAGEMLDRCLALGGRPYRYGCAKLSETQRTQLFGAAQQELERILLARSTA
jgi:hypothetical protein